MQCQYPLCEEHKVKFNENKLTRGPHVGKHWFVSAAVYGFCSEWWCHTPPPQHVYKCIAAVKSRSVSVRGTLRNVYILFNSIQVRRLKGKVHYMLCYYSASSRLKQLIPITEYSP